MMLVCVYAAVHVTCMMLVFDCSSARYMYDARVCMQQYTLHV
jgi:hypothetical protein